MFWGVWSWSDVFCGVFESEIHFSVFWGSQDIVKNRKIEKIEKSKNRKIENDFSAQKVQFIALNPLYLIQFEQPANMSPVAQADIGFVLPSKWPLSPAVAFART